jgi:SAM-dependent methyltransferase
MLKAWKGHEGPLLDSAKGFDVIDCRECGFRHIVPIPAPEELDEIYRREYYTREKPLYLAEVGEDRDWWELVHRERFESLERLLPGGRRRILDVGSGPGFFLAAGMARGWEALGIEPSAQAAAHARGLGVEVVEEFLSPLTAPALGRFDAVHLCNVLEHVPAPADLVRLVRGVLAPGGVACVVTPNDYNPLQQALRGSEGFPPWWVAPPHHVNYFDIASLGALLAREGFQVLEAGTTFPMELFLLMGEDYVGDPAKGRELHGRRKRLETALDRAGLAGLKRDLYGACARRGVGREAVLFARVEP